MAQFVSNERKKQGAGTVPKSARPQLDVSVELLDEMIKQLGDMRDYIISTTEENRVLRDKLAKIVKSLE
jgi:hypothetical protein